MANFMGAVAYIQKAEGGLSRATTDTASKHPSPWVYQGKTGWHTNRGITYQTFIQLSQKAGYAPSMNNFIFMPDSVWFGIYKTGFWEPMAGDLYTSQAIANAVVDDAWASGTGGAIKSLSKYLKFKGLTANNATELAKGFNQLVADQGEKRIFDELIDWRKQFFISLHQAANERGWLKRMDTLKEQGEALIGGGGGGTGSGSGKIIIYVILLAGLAAAGYYYYKHHKK
jgi:lysozyme family protein